ncbi:hypothetical protein [Vibrio phage J14]|nr:hypothetical protein [Vibrio phage J14]
MDHKFYHFSKWLYKEFSDTLVKIKPSQPTRRKIPIFSGLSLKC